MHNVAPHDTYNETCQIRSTNRPPSTVHQPRKRKVQVEPAVAKKVHSRLKAACYGTTPEKLFSRFDKDKTGTLDASQVDQRATAPAHTQQP